MKKIFLIFTFLILNVLFSGNTYAGVNEPGVTSIKGRCAGAFKHYHKKHIKKSLKLIKEKKQTLFSMLVVILVAIPMLIIKVKI